MAEGVTASIVIWCVGLSLLITMPIFMVIFQIFLESRKPKTKKRTEQGETLLFHNISLSVPTNGDKERLLLDDVSGIVHPGEVCAIMGQSGAGYLFLFHY